MTPEQHQEAADRLFQGENKPASNAAFFRLAYPGMTLDDAYAVQQALIRQKLASGQRRRSAGKSVSPAVPCSKR